MIKAIGIGCFHVEAHDAHSIEAELNRAHEMARDHAIQLGRHGVLLSRHGYTSFTVAISIHVPYGQTLECQDPF